jgi:hypothetical protein
VELVGPGTIRGLLMAGLFDGLVDDAGLFPPQRLPVDDAVRRHRAALDLLGMGLPEVAGT